MAVGNLMGIMILYIFWGEGKGFIWVVGYSLSSGEAKAGNEAEILNTLRPGSCVIFLTQPRPAHPGTTPSL